MKIIETTKWEDFWENQEKQAAIHRYIRRMAYGLCRNSATAKDLAQETFLIAFNKRDQLKNPEKIKPWMFVIMRNLFLGIQEKAKGKIFEDYNDLEDLIPSPAPPCNDGFSDEVAKARENVPAKYRVPLELAVISDLSYKEIAEMLDIPIGTVMSRISRGKEMMRLALGRQAKRQTTNAESG